MTDIVGPLPKKVPGMVIFAAVLNFLSAFFAGLGMLLVLVIAAIGNLMQMNQYVAEKLLRISSHTSYNYGLYAVLVVALAVMLFVFSFFLIAGIGLLKGKKFAWYLQIIINLFGLLGFLSGSVFSLVIPAIPVIAVLNVVILVVFFRSPIRAFFDV